MCMSDGGSGGPTYLSKTLLPNIAVSLAVIYEPSCMLFGRAVRGTRATGCLKGTDDDDVTVHGIEVRTIPAPVVDERLTNTITGALELAAAETVVRPALYICTACGATIGRCGKMAGNELCRGAVTAPCGTRTTGRFSTVLLRPFTLTNLFCLASPDLGGRPL